MITRLIIILTTAWVIENWLSYGNQTWYCDLQEEPLGQVWFPNMETLRIAQTEETTVKEALVRQMTEESRKAQLKYNELQRKQNGRK